MNKYFYKGATLNLVFATPIPESGERKTITGYAITATIQGITPVITPIDKYSFKLFLSEEQSLKLIATDVPVVVWLRKNGTTLIGRNTDLKAVDPKFVLPNEALDEPGSMSLIFGSGDTLSLEGNIALFPTSTYELWKESGHPNGTHAEFLASILGGKPGNTPPQYRDSPGVAGQVEIGAEHVHFYTGTSWKSVALVDVLELTPVEEGGE